MISTAERDRMFELHLENWDRNRMYPSGYRKEPTMIKMRMEHVNAICHAEFMLDAATSSVPIPKMRAQLEDDLLRLAELKMNVIEQLTGGKTLFDMKGNPVGNASTP